MDGVKEMVKRQLWLIWLSCLIVLCPIYEVAQAGISEFEVITPDNVSSLTEMPVAFTPNRDIFSESLRFLDDDTIIFIARDGVVRRWNVHEFPGREIANMGAAALAIVDSEGQSTICVCSDDPPNPHRDLKRIDLETGDVSVIVLEFGGVGEIELDSTNRYLGIAGGWTRAEQRVEIWQLNPASKLFVVGEEFWVFSVEFSPTEPHIFAAGFVSGTEIWNFATQSKLFTLEQELPMPQGYGYILDVGDVAFSEDGSVLASMSPEGFVWLWDVATGENLQLLRDDSIQMDYCDCYFHSNSQLVFNPEGSLLAVANGEVLRLWNIATGRLVRTINQPIAGFAFNSTGTLLSTVDAHGTIKFWSITNNVVS